MSLSIVLPDTLISVPSGKPLPQRDRDAFTASPALGRLLARGRWSPLAACDGDPLEHWLGREVGFSQSDPPAWAMLGAAGAAPLTRWWVSPVHVGIGREGVTLTPPEMLDLSDAEATTFNAVMQDLVSEAGWGPVDGEAALAPQFGVRMQTRQALSQSLPSPWSVARQRFTDLLPSGAGMADWRRLWMDLQMVLHSHPLNAQRQSRGLPVVNAYWWWGGGAACAPVAEESVRVLVSDLAQAPVFADQTSGRGLLGVHSRHRCAAWLAPLLAAQPASGSHSGGVKTVHLVENTNAAIWSQAGAKHPAVQALDSTLFAPLALAAAPHEAVLLGQSGWRCVASSAGLRMKFWKNSPGIDDLLEPVDGLLDESDLARAWQESAQRAVPDGGEFAPDRF